MTSLISLSDVELELQCTLPAAYTSEIITSMSDDAEDLVQFDACRVSFPGVTASIYKRAVLLAIVLKIVNSYPSLGKGNIQQIQEQDKSITYKGSFGMDSYKSEYNDIIKKLKIGSSFVSTSSTNEETFYRESTTEDETW